jgi:selenoprotein W-related protein
LASQLLTRYKQQIRSFELEPASGGCFELSVDGHIVYSKLQTSEFPREEAMVAAVGDLLA